MVVPTLRRAGRLRIARNGAGGSAGWRYCYLAGLVMTAAAVTFVVYGASAAGSGGLARAAGPHEVMSVQPVANPVWNVLDGVSCSSANVCTAVGSSSVLTPRLGTKSSATLAERWNGRSWAIQRIPSRAFSELTGVSCSSSHACTAVGDYSTPSGQAVTLAERWNGERWSVQRTPNPATAGGESVFSGVSCPSSGACVAVGYYRNLAAGHPGIYALVERWNGSRWAIQSTPTLATLRYYVLQGVSCSSPRACTAVGSDAANVSSIAAPLAERWNGQSWSIQTTPGPMNGNLAAVSCSSAVTCTAVGEFGLRATLAERWNGEIWAIQGTPNPAKAYDANLTGVSCSSGKACSADGFSLSGPLTVAERWNGTRWAIQRTLNPGKPGESDLNGVSCSSATACTAVGTFFITDGKHTLVERWNGTNWVLQRTPA